MRMQTDKNEMQTLTINRGRAVPLRAISMATLRMGINQALVSGIDAPRGGGGGGSCSGLAEG